MKIGPGEWALREQARGWLAESRPAIVVEVIAHAGSAPREAGARMLVAQHGVQGSIGGGHLEWQAVARARAMLASPTGAEPAAVLAQERHALGPSLGQCCGGSVELRYHRLTDAFLLAWPDTAPRFHLQLYGAGHVGRAVVELLSRLACTVDWIDEREETCLDDPPGLSACPQPPPHIRRRVTEPAEAEVRHAPPQSCYLVMTHRHDLDLRIAEAILKRADFRHFGLIGSRSKRARFEHRLLDRGIPPDTLARMRCPIGIDGLRGKEPEVIAISAVAELLQQT